MKLQNKKIIMRICVTKTKLCIFLFFLLLQICLKLSAADSAELLVGYFGVTKDYLKKTQADYNGVSLFFDINFSLKQLLEKINPKSKDKLLFSLEPFVNAISNPNDNAEVGCNFLLKYVFAITEKFQPYIKFGEGISYMTLHTKEQSTQYNFLSQAACGFHFFLKKNVALTFEYRYRHLSNASIKQPNSGINTDFILGGVTIFFDDTKSKNN